MRTKFHTLVICLAFSASASAKAIEVGIKNDGRHLQVKPSTPLTTSTPLPATSSTLPKILCLHGGGGSASSFSSELAALRASLSSYEFVFAQAPDNGLWMRDPPSGKGEPTTDPNWASTSIGILDEIVRTQGPFYGILGYSQGAAFAPVYLSTVAAGTFQVAILFCGYLPSTHLGLMQRIEAQSPWGGVRALVFMGARDTIITNTMTTEQASKFTAPTIVRSSVAGHHPPQVNDPTYGTVVSFLSAGSPPVPAPIAGPVASPGPTPTSKPDIGKPPPSSAAASPPAVLITPTLPFTYTYPWLIPQGCCSPQPDAYYDDPARDILNDGDIPNSISTTNSIEFTASMNDYDPVFDFGQRVCISSFELSYIITRGWNKFAPQRVTFRGSAVAFASRNATDTLTATRGSDFPDNDGANTVVIPSEGWAPVRYVMLDEVTPSDGGTTITEVTARGRGC